MTKRFILSAMIAMALTTAAIAQDGTAPSTPFAYPVAPDTCSTLEGRCNYIITHFWDNYNISRPIADDAAFDRAFRDWVGFFPYAHRNIVMSSIRDFLFKAQSNTPNLLKVGTEAEAALYSPEAEFWSDEVYIAFAQFMSGAKQLKNDVRGYYRDQVMRINSNQEGMPMNLEYTGLDGQRHKLQDLDAEGYIVLFTDDGIDSSIDRTRLSADATVNMLIEGGKLVVVNIVAAKYSQQWKKAAEAYPTNWTVGCNEKLMQMVDARALPVIYLLGKDCEIMRKNVTVEGLKAALGN